MWWQWILGFVGMVVVVVGMLAAFYLGGKIAKGESIVPPKPKPPPVARLDSVRARNAALREMRAKSEEEWTKRIEQNS